MGNKKMRPKAEARSGSDILGEGQFHLRNTNVKLHRPSVALFITEFTKYHSCLCTGVSIKNKGQSSRTFWYGVLYSM